MSRKRNRKVAFADEVTTYEPDSPTLESQANRPNLSFGDEFSNSIEPSSDYSNLQKQDDLQLGKSEFTPGSRLREHKDSDSDAETADFDEILLTSRSQEKNASKKKLIKMATLRNDQCKITKDKLLSTELDDETLSAQEVALDFSGDTKVTPFNYSEEMEEGRFDAEGNYFPFKEEEVDDAWLTSIDWSNVDEEASYFNISNTSPDFTNLHFKVKSNTNKSTSETQQALLPLQECIQSILKFLNHGETVTKALNRLKPNKFDSKLKNKDSTVSSPIATTLESDTPISPGEISFNQLTDLSDMMFYYGCYDIYSATYEKLRGNLTYLVNKTTNDTETSTKSSTNEDSEEVFWEYKIISSSEETIYGPFSSSQMFEWSNQGYFDKDVEVRKTDNKTNPFYDAKRIDFELYT